MGEIKIINVLKGDSFEEIFEEFKKAKAQEVIFILPKNSEVAGQENNFVLLAQAAQDDHKTISLMTADPTASQWAEKYGFKFLSAADESEDQEREPEGEELEKPEEAETEIPEEENGSEDDEEDTALDQSGHNNQDFSEFPELEKTAETLPSEPTVSLTAAKDTVGRWLDKDIRAVEKKTRSLKLRGEKPVSSSLAISRKGETSRLDKIKNLDRIWLRERDQHTNKWPGGLAFRPIPKKLWGGFKMSAFASSRKIRFIYLAIIGLGLLTTILILYFALGNAQIIIYPQKQPLDFKIPVTVAVDLPLTVVEEGKIPGQLITSESKISRDFSSSGQREVASKARGELTVYNNFNSEPQTFVATTRFESSGGLIFRTPRPITIPGARLVNGKLVPGSVSVEVIADKPGEGYNIAPDRFTIPGLKGGPRYEGFYADSASAMHGGKIGWSKVVTEKDFRTAKESVVQESLDQALGKLKEEQKERETATEAESKILSLKSTAEIDEAAEGLTMQATAQAQTIVFDKKDLLSLTEAFLNQRSDQPLVLLTDRLSWNYQEAKIDWPQKLLTFVLEVKGEAAAKISQEKIIDNMLDMPQKKIKDYLLSVGEIESAKVFLSPFWVRRVPKNPQDVEIQIIYQNSSTN